MRLAPHKRNHGTNRRAPKIKKMRTAVHKTPGCAKFRSTKITKRTQGGPKASSSRRKREHHIYRYAVLDAGIARPYKQHAARDRGTGSAHGAALGRDAVDGGLILLRRVVLPNHLAGRGVHRAQHSVER